MNDDSPKADWLILESNEKATLNINMLSDIGYRSKPTSKPDTTS